MFQGNTYLITGASADSEIGLAICRLLAGEGARLILAGRRESALQETADILAQIPSDTSVYPALTESDVTNTAASKKHIVAPIDLDHLEQIKPWFTALVKEHGPLDGLVHSASFQGYSPLRAITPTQIQNYLNVNVSAAILLLSSLIKKGQHAPNAAAVLVSSVAGAKGLKARTLYAASKAALNSVTQSVALEFADKGLRINAVAPGLVDGVKAQEQFALLTPAQVEALQQAHPLGLVSPEDVASAVSYLLSPSSGKMTGTIVPVDGGFLAQ